ncbi:MAG: dienelactone hydrolase family protein [Deltaproteobacteria bacterium]|nr:MAG: dienelactone hydrolase family protein [Deltaproteobacteria bacterium]
MGEIEFDLKTDDGTCPCYAYTAPGERSAPPVIFYMDGIGIRPDLRAMAERLASSGYFVLLPNLYYRGGKTPAFDPATMMTDPAQRDRMMQLLRTVTRDNAMADTRVFLEYLSDELKVSGSRVGCVGYCMGGSVALNAAGTFPDRIAAAASIHGAGLATDAPDSPHKLVGKIRGAVYVAVAGIDPWLQPGETERLRDALDAAGTRYRIEDYPGVHHGFAANGTPHYDRTAAERHWERILALFGDALA